MRRIYLPYGETDVRPGMDGRLRERMIDLHRTSLSYFSYSPYTLFWESREGQELRFRMLAEIGITAGDSLLDVGCGFGDLYGWLNDHALPVAYTGIDLSQDILDIGVGMNAALNLQQGEIFDFDWQPQQFDWVLLSGTLSWNLEDDGAYTWRVIKEMFKLARLGVAFNMLNNSDYNDTIFPELRVYDKDEVFSFCKEIAPDCQLKTDYLDNDFTIYMRRGA